MCRELDEVLARIRARSDETRYDQLIDDRSIFRVACVTERYCSGSDRPRLNDASSDGESTGTREPDDCKRTSPRWCRECYDGILGTREVSNERTR